MKRTVLFANGKKITIWHRYLVHLTLVELQSSHHRAHLQKRAVVKEPRPQPFPGWFY